MENIGFQDLPDDARHALRDVPKLIETATDFRRGLEGRCYVRLGKPALECYELDRLVHCPVFARVISEHGGLTLQFDPTREAAVTRERKRRALRAERESI